MDVFTKSDLRSGYLTMCNSLLMEEACSSWSWHFLIRFQNGGRCRPFFGYRNRFSCQYFCCENTHEQTPFCATSQRHADGDVGSARSYGTGCGGVGDVEFKAPTIDLEILWNSDIAAHTVYTHAHHIISSCIEKIAFLLSSLWNSDWLKYQVINDMFSSYSTWAISNPIQLSITRLETRQAVASATPERLMSTMSQFSEADLSIWPINDLHTGPPGSETSTVVFCSYCWCEVCQLYVYIYIYYMCRSIYIYIWNQRRVSKISRRFCLGHQHFLPTWWLLRCGWGGTCVKPAFLELII